MIFIETNLFTKLLSEYLTDEQYRQLQEYLLENPLAGDLIKETGGLRKLRWASGGKGKRGGIRIIYYYLARNNNIYLMTLYAKNELSDLTNLEKRELRKIIDEIFKRH